MKLRSGRALYGTAVFAALLIGLFPGLALDRAEAAPSAHEVATDLAQLGPRPDGSLAQARAALLLQDALRRAGLRDVRASASAIEGVLPGATDREIVLSGHYDTVARSPGAGDDGSGCAVAIAAAADLARTPLSHTVRVVLFNGEEEGLLGSGAWAAALDAAHRERILADLNLEMLGWPGSPGPTLHALPVRLYTGKEKAGGRPAGERVLPPGWLVHALLRSGEAVGWPLEMSDPQFPLLMQLVQRSARVSFGADSENLLARGIPAITVSDSSFLSLDPAYHTSSDVAANLDPRRLEQWTTAVAATVRRLDRLAGPPVSEDQYLVVGGRVFLRRDILLIGFVLWAALVFRGIPGRWRGATAEQRQHQRGRYLPGYLFRGLLILALLAAPVHAVLLLPAAVLALFPPRRTALRLLWIALGLLPLLLFESALVSGIFAGVVNPRGGLQIGWPTVLVILGAFLAYGLTISLNRPLPASDSSST